MGPQPLASNAFKSPLSSTSQGGCTVSERARTAAPGQGTSRRASPAMGHAGPRAPVPHSGTGTRGEIKWFGTWREAVKQLQCHRWAVWIFPGKIFPPGCFPCVTCSAWPCLGSRVGLEDLQMSLPTLIFRDSAIPSKKKVSYARCRKLSFAYI